MPCKIDDYSGCLYYSANALSRLMTKMAEEEFVTTGLAPSYAFLLMSVYKYPGISPMELSNHMQLTPSTVTRLLDKMEVKGFILRNSIGRSTEILPTEKCMEMEPRIKECWKNLNDRYVKLIGTKDAKQLTCTINETLLKLEP